VPLRPQTIAEFHWLLESARVPRLRSIREFAEQDVVIPEGRYEGMKYRVQRMPWQGLWLDAVDSGRWRRFVLTACVQGGKTFVGWNLPILYHIFELRENFGAGLPSMDMAIDKWKLELEPIIDASPKLRAQKPETGRGSRGGRFEALTFQHGPTLKFLSGHGGDEKRSGTTLRGSAVTEADRLDAAGEASREAAPIYQIEARSLSYEEQGRFYAECTSTIPTGFVAKEQAEGTGTRPFAQCRECKNYVSPEREHLVGWQEAESKIEAKRITRWCCPACGIEINDAERRRMAQQPVAVHRNQTIDKRGRIHGDAPETDTFTLRVNSFWNLFWSTGFIGGEEWAAQRDKDAESAERRMRQWYWAIPIEPNEFDLTPLSADDVLGTQVETLRRGDVPAGTIKLSGAADVRKTQIHFIVLAWLAVGDEGFRVHVVDVGAIPVEAAKYGTRKALRLAIRILRARIEAGYRELASDRVHKPGWFFVDAGWQAAVVRAFIRECHDQGLRRYLPSFGRGLSASERKVRYQQPTATSATKPHIGEEYYIAWHDRHALHAAIVNADAWKTTFREGFTTPPGQPGSISTFEGVTEDEQRLLRQFAKETTAERAVERIVPERGPVTVWINESRRPNHLGDCLYEALAAGHLCGMLIDAVLGARAAARPPAAESSPALVGEEGVAYLASHRGD
jgi:hypothetical protein